MSKIGERGAAWLRTVVPGLWATLVTWLVSVADWLPSEVVEALETPQTVAAVVAVVLAGWYAVARAIEPYIPVWLRRIILGSAQEPTYDGHRAERRNRP